MDKSGNDRVTRVIQALLRAPSALKVREIFGRAIEGYGYTHFLCSAPPLPDEGPFEPLLFERWPAEWLDLYVERRYYTRDPMVFALGRATYPFTWEEAVKAGNYSKADLAIVYEPASWGMRKGLVVPMHGVRGHVVTMAGDDDARTDAEASAHLHLFAMYAYSRAYALSGRKQPIPLSRRQLEVLQWAALGKTDGEVGEIMDISAKTAHHHIEAAKRAFGVSTRMQAVIAAIRQGDLRA